MRTTLQLSLSVWAITCSLLFIPLSPVTPQAGGDAEDKVTAPPIPGSADAWLQTLSSLLSPSLASAIRQGRDHARVRGRVIPPAVRRVLAPFFSARVFEKVRYSTDWQEVTAEGAVYQILLGSGANAVTLMDVVIFRDAQLAADPILWAHELTHVEQYDRLGVDAFAADYLQHPDVLEQEAIAKADRIKKRLSSPGRTQRDALHVREVKVSSE